MHSTRIVLLLVCTAALLISSVDATCTASGCNFGADASSQCYNNPQKYPSDSPFCPNQYDVSCSYGHCQTDIPGTSTPYGKYSCEQIGHWEDPGYCAYTMESVGPCPPKGYPCFCNCYCFAYGTNITMSDDSVKEVQNLVKGDTVLVLKDITSPPTWQSGEITLSSGSSNLTKSYVVRVEFEGGVIMVNPVQLFYVWDKISKSQILVQAGNLSKTNHQLLDKNFGKHNILSLVTGTEDGGLWSLVANGKEVSIPHHLFLAQGVVAGDFFLQQDYIHNQTKKSLTQTHSALHPAYFKDGVGTLEYHKIHGDTFTAADQERFDHSHHPLDAKFRPFHPDYETKAPRTAKYLIPQEIGSNSSNFIGKLVPTSDRVRYADTQFVLSVWRGLKPDIEFTLTWGSDEVNAYSWIRRGFLRDTLHIQIEGGLARHANLTWKGISFIIARQVGQLEPIAASWTYGHRFPHGYTCEDYSDWVAPLKFSAFCSESENGPMPVYTAFAPIVINEVSNFYKTLPDYNPVHASFPGCGFPPGITAECRNSTYWAGIFNSPLPDCWTTAPLKPIHPHGGSSKSHHSAKDEL